MIFTGTPARAIRTVSQDTIEQLAFDHPGSQITAHRHGDVEIRELIIDGAVYEARVPA